jgi:hypothetical protein
MTTEQIQARLDSLETPELIMKERQDKGFDPNPDFCRRWVAHERARFTWLLLHARKNAEVAQAHRDITARYEPLLAEQAKIMEDNPT